MTEKTIYDLLNEYAIANRIYGEICENDLRFGYEEQLNQREACIDLRSQIDFLLATFGM